MKKGDSPLKTSAVVIGGKYYRVEDMPSEEERGSQNPRQFFRKGIAYHLKTSLTNLLLPYRGVIDGWSEIDSGEMDVGIYCVKKSPGVYGIYIQRPRTKAELRTYAGGQERDIMVAVNEFTPDQFADIRVAAPDAGGKIFYPPLHVDDDALNLLMKTAIRLKHAPWEPYGKRLETLAVEKGHGIEGVNIKNNAKRAIVLNRAMSPNKFLQYGDTYETLSCFLVTDRPGAMHPMSEDGKIYAIFPNGHSFPIDPEKIVDITPMIEEGLKETAQIEDEEET